MKTIERVLVLAILCAAVAGLTAPPANAGGRATIKGGQEIRLQIYTMFKVLTCEGLRVTVKIVKSPERGRLRKVNTYFDPADGTSTGFHANRCHGTKIPATAFYYRAPKGFRGTEHIVLRPVGINGGINEHFYITVK